MGALPRASTSLSCHANASTPSEQANTTGNTNRSYLEQHGDSCILCAVDVGQGVHRRFRNQVAGDDHKVMLVVTNRVGARMVSTCSVVAMMMMMVCRLLWVRALSLALSCLVP